MSFAFNFSLAEAASSAENPASALPQQQPESVPAAPAAVHHTRRGERFHWHGAADALLATEFTPVVLPPAVGSAHALQFDIVNASDASFIKRTGAISSILTTSDLHAGVYEGGFKLWECALDLVHYMAAQARFQSLSTRRVAELGCGHGLPGIYALQRGADHVAFMDYNKEVLELTTCPNVHRNVNGDAQLLAKASFYAGEWGSVSELLRDVERLPDEHQQFDLILTAETIYTEAVAIELFQTIKRHLRCTPDAVALVAAKKYYFGTGGSVQHFMELVHRDSALRASVVWEESDGRSNMRAIIEVTPAL